MLDSNIDSVSIYLDKTGTVHVEKEKKISSKAVSCMKLHITIILKIKINNKS